MKVYKREVVQTIDVTVKCTVYSSACAQNGFHQMGETVQHQARKHGTSKFGMERFVRGFLDLITRGLSIWKTPHALLWTNRNPNASIGLWIYCLSGIDKLFVHTSSPLIRPYGVLYRINHNDSRIEFFNVAWLS